MTIRDGVLIAICLLSVGTTATVVFLDQTSLPSVIPTVVTSESPQSAIVPPTDTIEQLEKSLAKLEKRLEQNETALLRLSGQVETLSEMPQVSSHGKIEDSLKIQQRRTLSSEEIKELNQRRLDKNAERLTDLFHSQTPDPTWSPDASAFIAATLTDNPDFKGVSLVANECRESLCRIEVQMTDSIQKGQLEEKLPLLLGEKLPNMTVFEESQPDGSIYSVIFLGK